MVNSFIQLPIICSLKNSYNIILLLLTNFISVYKLIYRILIFLALLSHCFVLLHLLGGCFLSPLKSPPVVVSCYPSPSSSNFVLKLSFSPHPEPLLNSPYLYSLVVLSVLFIFFLFPI